MTKTEMQTAEMLNEAVAYRIADATLKRIKWAYRNKMITGQQARTLRGQALAGDCEGADRGLSRLIRGEQTNREGGRAE